MSAVLWLAACRVPRPPPPDPTHSAVHDHTGPSVVTHSGVDVSSAHTGSTGTEGGWTFSFVPPPPVSPWVVLTAGADTNLGLKLHNLGDTDGDGLDELAVGYQTPYPYPDVRFRVVSAGLLTGGERLASAVSVATLPNGTFSSGYVASAGDTNHDGFGDVWLLSTLWRGPFQGDYADDAYDINILGSANDGVIGGFDADGDGWTDMAQSDVSGNLDVYYGPFPEDRYGRYSYDARFEASDNTWIQGAGQYSGGQTRYLGAMNAPEEHLVTSGWNCWDSSCDDARVYDIAGPRDRVIPWDTNLATFPSAAAPDWTLVPMADADGDGLRELLYLGSYRVGTPVAGLYPRNVDTDDSREGLHHYTWDYNIVSHPCGDVTGDGLADVLVDYADWSQTTGDGEPTTYWAAVPGNAPATGPHWLVQDWSVGLAFPAGFPGGKPTGITCANLDGDALAEVVFGWGSSLDGAGTVHIWRGSDLAAAYQSGLSNP